MKKATLLNIIMSIVFISCISLNPINADTDSNHETNKAEELFILKPIGYYKMREFPVDPSIKLCSDKEYYCANPIISTDGLNRSLYYTVNKLVGWYTLFYSYVKEGKINDDGWCARCPTSSIEIYEYSNAEFIKQDILLYRMDLWWKVYKTKEIEKYEFFVRSLVGNKLLVRKLKTGKGEEIIWISGRYAIILDNRKITIEDDPSLILAYLKKYPSTWDIELSDFNGEKIVRTEIRRFMDIIKEQESKRGSLNKIEEYKAMNYQCEFEANTRCWTGDRQKGCPITMEMNRSERREQWDEFEARVTSIPLDMNNIHWFNFHLTECQDIEQIYIIAEKLGLPKALIPEVYKWYYMAAKIE